MPVAKVKEGSLALPDDVKDALGIEEGEALYVEVVADSLIVRRAPLSDRERAEAWDRLLAMSGRPAGAGSADPDELEEGLFRDVEEARRRGGVSNAS